MLRASLASALFHAALLALLAGCGLVGCGPGATETSCTDGVDNDGNGQIDCADPACGAHVSCGGTDGGMSDGGPEPTCPADCAGCCDGARCLSGMSLAACGTGGAACEACAIGATCEATGCEGGPVLCGPGNCDGCCMGDVCVGGESMGACGTSGGACEACESFEACRSGVCGVDPATSWRISLIDALIPEDNLGSSWDAIGGGEVDPYVELRVGSASADGIEMPTIDGTRMPDWTEGGTETVLSPAFTAAELSAFLRFDLWDEDTGGPDDVIGMCVVDDVSPAFGGEIQTHVCDANPNAGYTLRWQLLPD